MSEEINEAVSFLFETDKQMIVFLHFLFVSRTIQILFSY